MSFISVFDVMGPNMIGPSSSHTAGAARIGFLAQKMINGPLKKVEFTLQKKKDSNSPLRQMSWKQISIQTLLTSIWSTKAVRK